MASAGGTIEGIMGNVWVGQRWLGVDGGGRGGRRNEAAGGGCYFYDWPCFLLFGLQGQEAAHPGSLVLTQQKNLHVRRLFIFRL